MKHTHKILMSVAMAAIVLVSLGAISTVSAAQGSSANVQAPPLVGASITGAPAVVSQDGTSLDLFVRGTDLHLYWLHSVDGTTWTPSNAVDLGGVSTSNPAATSSAPGTIYVFVRGGDGALWSRSTTNAGDATPTWSTWTKIGGQLLAGTSPAAYFGNTGQDSRIGWFVTGTNHKLYQQWSDNGGAPSSWQDLGGYLTSGPGATALSDGTQIGVVVGGTNSVIYYMQFTGAGWSKWAKTNGQLLNGTSPTAYNWGTERIGWFVTGTNSKLYHTWAGRTTGYENLGGVLTSSPGATSKGDHLIDVFARGSGGGMAALWQISYNVGGSGDWTAWKFVGQVGP